MGVMVENTSGVVISLQGLADGLDAAFAGVAVQDDVFDDHDGVVDDETDGGCETAEGHQVEALAGES